MSPPGKITFGQQLSSLQAGGFIFTETLHPPHLLLERHDHECANFNLTIRGRYEETVRGRTEVHGPSTLSVKPPGEAHANRYGHTAAWCLIVEVTPAILDALGPRRRAFDAPVVLHRGPLVALARRMHAELRSRDSASDLVLEGLGLEFLGQAARRTVEAAPKTLPKWLRDAQEHIHESFTEPLGLAVLAESSGHGTTYFARTFRKWFGCSVGEYVRRLRLERAAEQVAASDLPLAEIARSGGFFDQSHLTNAFKRNYGVTPAEFRRRARLALAAPGHTQAGLSRGRSPR